VTIDGIGVSRHHTGDLVGNYPGVMELEVVQAGFCDGIGPVSKSKRK